MLDLWTLLNAVPTAASLLGGEPVLAWTASSCVITFLQAYCFCKITDLSRRVTPYTGEPTASVPQLRK